MIKTCTRCGEEKDVELFPKNTNGKYGRHSYCRLCRKKYDRERWENGLDQKVRAVRLDKKYGMTPEDWDRLHDEQLGRCPICLRTLAEVGSIHIDHDHTTGKIRGLLCNCCNMGIGQLQDSPDVIRRALQYLEPIGEEVSL